LGRELEPPSVDRGAPPTLEAYRAWLTCLGVVLHLEFFKKQVRTGTHECVWGLFGGDHRFDVAVLGIEPTKKVEDLTWLRHRLADVAKAVGELLQARGVLGDVHVALMKRAELSLVVGGSLKFVVAEHAFDVTPDSERRGVRLVDDVEDSLGDGGVEPIDDASINHALLGIALRD
jgi:hypothetical protein